MGPWAKTVGGILKTNGFTDFLNNAAERKAVDDPMRKAIALLGSLQPDKALRPSEWAKLAVAEGLDVQFFSPSERGTAKGQERAIGVVLKRFVNESFTHYGDVKTIKMILDGGKRRWKPGKNGHVRYLFQTVSVNEVPNEDEQSQG